MNDETAKALTAAINRLAAAIEKNEPVRFSIVHQGYGEGVGRGGSPGYARDGHIGHAGPASGGRGGGNG